MRKTDMFDLNSFLKSKISYVSSGLFVSDGEWIHPARKITGYELMYVIKGNVLINEGGTDYMITEREAFFLRPDVEHHGIRPSDEEISFFWVHFDFVGNVPEIINPQTALITNDSNMHILMRQLIHYANTPRYPIDCCNDLLQMAIIEVLLSQSESSSGGNALINKIQQWIRINYDKNITLEDIENQFNYNRDYISRLFKKTFGTGIKQYTDEVKMNKAKELILSGTPLSDIPDMLGIESYNLFLKKFKYHEGVTPKSYRESYSGLHLNKK